MVSRSTLGCSHWWEFIYTCHHDITMTSHHSKGLVTPSVLEIHNKRAISPLPMATIRVLFFEFEESLEYERFLFTSSLPDQLATNRIILGNYEPE